MKNLKLKRYIGDGATPYAMGTSREDLEWDDAGHSDGRPDRRED